MARYTLNRLFINGLNDANAILYFNIHSELNLLKINRSQNMENPTSTSPILADLRRIPRAVWFLLAGFVVALVAIFVFKVAVGTVVSYSFLGLMMFSHLFMHSGHESHGSHSAQPGQGNSQAADNANPDQKDSHTGHGGCH